MRAGESGGRAPQLSRGLFVSLLTFGFLGLLLCVAEVVMRIFNFGIDVSEPRYAAHIEFLTPCFHVEGHGEGQTLVLNPTSDPNWRPTEIPRAHQPGVTRIAVVGESNAAILGGILQQRVASSLCGAHCEILNCGVAGGAAEIVERRVEEVLAYSPDVIVMIFGHNFRYRQDFPASLALLELITSNPKARWLLASRLVSSLVLRPAQPADRGVERGGVGPADNPQSRSERSQLISQEIIRRIVERVRAANVFLVISTLGANLLQPPAIPVDAPADLDIVEARFTDAVAGRAAAERNLENALAAAPSANGEFLLGLWRLVDGDTESARGHLQRALELDYVTPRAPASLNDFLRSLADGEKIFIWDGEQIHRDAAPSRIPGWETFADCCHFAPLAAQRTLRGLFDRAREVLDLEPCALGPAPQTEAELAWFFLRDALAHDHTGETRRDWSLGITAGLLRGFALDEPRTRNEVRSFLRGAAWSAASPADRISPLDGIGWGFREAGRHAEAYRFNDLACAVDRNATAQAQRALWLLADGKREDSYAAIAKAAAFGPQRAEIRRLVELFSQLDAASPVVPLS